MGGEGGHLFRLTYSVVLWGRRSTANKYPWRVLTVSWPHWVCPRSRCVCFPSLRGSDSRLLCVQLSEAGPGLRALPRSKPFRFRFSGTPQRHRVLGLRLVPFSGPSSSGDQVLGDCTLLAGWCILSPPWSQPLHFLGAP